MSEPFDSYVYVQVVLSRGRAIRAVVAAQWAIAITLFYRFAIDVPETGSDYERGTQDVAEDLAALPCAVDVVDGVA